MRPPFAHGPAFAYAVVAHFAAVMSVGRLLFAAVCSPYIFLAVRYEERDFAAQHGPTYDAYRAQVPRFGLRLPRRGSSSRLSHPAP